MVRDWSFAGDIVNAIDLLLEKKMYEEYVIGSGVGTTIENIISYVFGYFDLDYKKFIEIDSSLLREDSPQSIISDPTKLKQMSKNSVKLANEFSVDRNFRKLELIIKNLSWILFVHPAFTRTTELFYGATIMYIVV